ncbi:FxsB family radical SAM/SPASM domain protein [Actinoallomurus purpureus]|uniref:FxsB family cyclophane-forming radical SAM/SPASM peptide maturase n=1 Tax=Actinoallomurus purpureus TaxID=478114 RepID=UPI002093B186|nr:FxsB family cyclophane-forming radical SAM/SPASM peptide maturase [Actinoallomurus purpureus]MCO6003861.1 FxsB family radical SAM/SPASM domain protein [Actinoallomurus purpureus]
MADRTDALEWPMNLDVEALLRDGWHPTPFRQFIVKIHSRCNLACDYCYVYEMADQGWRDRPRRMTPATIALIASRIAEHVRAHRIPEVDLIFHGGEPLLAGIELIRHAVTTVRSAVGPEASVNVRVQSNGLLLDSAFLRTFDELGVRVGISLDGDARGNDRHRRHADGRGSHDEVRAALERLTAGRYRHLFGGLLATVDLRNDPVATYEALLEFAPAEVDFLLPHGNWNSPPPGLSPGEHATPYGDWLIAAFDRWYGAPVRETRVRLFGEIIRLLLGGASRIESVGLSPVAMVVLETDGSIEQVDTLKSVYEGASATGLHVARDSFDAVLRLPSVAARQIGDRALSAQCRGCAIRRVCGGGLYTHRYRAGSGFANPSVYCADLVRLITHVHQVIAGDLREGTA